MNEKLAVMMMLLKFLKSLIVIVVMSLLMRTLLVGVKKLRKMKIDHINVISLRLELMVSLSLKSVRYPIMSINLEMCLEIMK